MKYLVFLFVVCLPQLLVAQDEDYSKPMSFSLVSESQRIEVPPGKDVFVAPPSNLMALKSPQGVTHPEGLKAPMGFHWVKKSVPISKPVVVQPPVAKPALMLAPVVQPAPVSPRIHVRYATPAAPSVTRYVRPAQNFTKIVPRRTYQPTCHFSLKGQKWYYRGSNLASHLLTTHGHTIRAMGYTRDDVFRMTRNQLVNLHSNAHERELGRI